MATVIFPAPMKPNMMYARRTASALEATTRRDHRSTP